MIATSLSDASGDTRRSGQLRNRQEVVERSGKVVNVIMRILIGLIEERNIKISILPPVAQGNKGSTPYTAD